jgi:hypothetical protein
MNEHGSKQKRKTRVITRVQATKEGIRFSHGADSILLGWSLLSMAEKITDRGYSLEDGQTRTIDVIENNVESQCSVPASPHQLEHHAEFRNSEHDQPNPKTFPQAAAAELARIKEAFERIRF